MSSTSPSLLKKSSPTYSVQNAGLTSTGPKLMVTGHSPNSIDAVARYSPSEAYLSSPCSSFRPSPTKAIAVDLKNNFIAQPHYESDPKKHYLSTARSDFKRFNLIQERKLNQKMVCNSASHQRSVCDHLTKMPVSRASSPTFPRETIPNVYFDSACPRSPSPIRNRGAWHL
jgi:hypothetical protein